MDLCIHQTYRYEDGVQRATFCDRKATMTTRALDGSTNRLCAEHGQMSLDAGARLVR